MPRRNAGLTGKIVFGAFVYTLAVHGPLRSGGTLNRRLSVIHPYGLGPVHVWLDE